METTTDLHRLCSCASCRRLWRGVPESAPLEDATCTYCGAPTGTRFVHHAHVDTCAGHRAEGLAEMERAAAEAQNERQRVLAAIDRAARVQRWREGRRSLRGARA